MQYKIGLKEKIGYGLGDAGTSIFWKLFTMYLMFFYTDVFGISASVVGTMFFITRIWDAAFDPFVGIFADRTQTRWGKFRPYLLWMMLPFGILGVLIFTIPPYGITGKIAYAYLTYSLMMMTYSLINVPYASLLGVITADRKERTTLSTYRMLFAFGGSLLVLGSAEPLVSIFSNLQGETDVAAGWHYAAVLFAVAAVSCFYLCFLWTTERIEPSTEKTSLRNDLKDLWANRPWFILLEAGVAVIFFNSIRDGAAIYYFKYYTSVQNFQLGLSVTAISLSSFYFVLGQAANIVGVVLAIPVSNRIGKKNTFLIAMLLAAFLSIAFYFVGKKDIATLFILQFFISLCAGITLPLIWSMYADAADYSEWKTQRRATGLVFSASSMSQKFGWTIGGALTGWLLGYYGFEANAAQTEFAQMGIRMMVSIIPAIGAALGALFMLLYPLHENKMEKIVRELKKSRENTLVTT